MFTHWLGIRSDCRRFPDRLCKQVYNSHLFPTFYLINAGLPGMLERRSSGIIALGGQAEMSPYNIGGIWRTPAPLTRSGRTRSGIRSFRDGPGFGGARIGNSIGPAGDDAGYCGRLPVFCFGRVGLHYRRPAECGGGTVYRLGEVCGWGCLPGQWEEMVAGAVGQGLRRDWGRDVAAMRSNRWAYQRLIFRLSCKVFDGRLRW